VVVRCNFSMTASRSPNWWIEVAGWDFRDDSNRACKSISHAYGTGLYQRQKTKTAGIPRRFVRVDCFPASVCDAANGVECLAKFLVILRSIVRILGEHPEA